MPRFRYQVDIFVLESSFRQPAALLSFAAADISADCRFSPLPPSRRAAAITLIARLRGYSCRQAFRFAASLYADFPLPPSSSRQPPARRAFMITPVRRRCIVLLFP